MQITFKLKIKNYHRVNAKFLFSIGKTKNFQNNFCCQVIFWEIEVRSKAGWPHPCFSAAIGIAISLLGSIFVEFRTQVIADCHLPTSWRFSLFHLYVHIEPESRVFLQCKCD